MRLKRLNAHKIPILFALTTLLSAVALTSATKNPFTPHDRAFYASERDVNFVRPGLEVRILSASIAADGTITARVRFTDAVGLPLDRQGVTTPGAISNGNPSMLAAVYRTDEQYFHSYTTRTQTSPITGTSAIQAGADSGGTWQQVADGEYTYTFRTKAPSDIDRNAIHAVGVYANRNLTEFDMGVQLDDDAYYFRPSDGQEVDNPDEEILTATCQKCHGPNMAFHGQTGRTSMQSCDLCHTPQTVDPDTGNTVDMKVMIHKIHMGANLPSVQAGTPYRIIGNQQSVHDYSNVHFSAPIMKCQVCHESNTEAANHQDFLSNPSRAACGSCHDNVNFATGEGHVGLPVFSDAQCRQCHIPEGEIDFDASILGAHTVPQESNLLGGLQWGIERVENGTAGSRPTVTFTVKDKDGNPLPLSALQRVAVTMAGPTTDYVAFGSGYVQENAASASGANGTYTYTFNQAIPADARGTFAIGVEGRRDEIILEGTQKQRSVRYGATNPVAYFSVDGSPVQERRDPTTNCQACHYRLALHGENRVNNVQYCAFCHNPVGTDAAQRRPEVTEPAQSIDMKFMIHRIHSGAAVYEESGQDYAVYGFGGNRISYAQIHSPVAMNNCFMCHQNGSENPGVTLGETAHPVTTPQYPINPMQPVTNACFGCHSSNAMLSHALTNTTQLGESCRVCHGMNSEFSATRVHSNVVTVSRDQATK